MDDLAATALAGALAGLAVAVPVGAVGVLVIDAGVRGGLLRGLAAGLGVALADLAYALVAAAAGGAVAPTLEAHAGTVRVAAAAVLVCAAALVAWRVARSPVPARAPPASAGELARTTASFVALTLVNPMTAATFAAVVLGLGADGPAGPAAVVAFALAAFAASLAWQSLIGAAGALVGARLGPRARAATGIAGAAIAGALAVRFLLG